MKIRFLGTENVATAGLPLLEEVMGDFLNIAELSHSIRHMETDPVVSGAYIAVYRRLLNQKLCDFYGVE